MSKIINYTVVHHSRLVELIALVRKLIQEEDWQPLGAATIEPESDNCYSLYCQTLVKYGDEQL